MSGANSSPTSDDTGVVDGIIMSLDAEGPAASAPFAGDENFGPPCSLAACRLEFGSCTDAEAEVAPAVVVVARGSCRRRPRDGKLLELLALQPNLALELALNPKVACDKARSPA